MFINLLARVYISFGSFKMGLDNPGFWIGAGTILLFLWRWWGIKKLLSFGIVIFILLFIIFKVDGFLIGVLGKDESDPFVLLAKPFFIAISVAVFLCYSFLSKD
jgi:hypothetical protein